MAAPEPNGGRERMQSSRVLPALIVGQLGLHAAMAGLRMAAPLQALRQGASAWTVGLLLALFAVAPVLLALHAGRLADRLGYHTPVRIAVGASLAGMALAVAAALSSGVLVLALLCAAAACTGAAANMGMLTIQRTAGVAARDATERMRVFSWLGIAPAFSNVLGPVAAGLMIDHGGFAAAYALLGLVPLATWATMRLVPAVAPAPAEARREATAWELLALPGMRRLLLVNWLFSTCWDVHTFAVPVLGHERGFSASTIGLVLGTFTLAITVVRVVVPLVAERIDTVAVLRAAMLASAAVFVLFPFARQPWQMACCAGLLGLAMGVAQPLIMTTLHHLTPEGRHGQSIALRSMIMNASGAAMPLAFGALGAAAGASLLFWIVGGAIGCGSTLTGRLARPRT